MENDQRPLTDPLYLTALAGLGASLPARLTEKPGNNSIAVLPFANSSGDPAHESFTDGLTEDLIVDLSNVPGFFVIARNSTFAYKGKPTDVRQVAHDLGVRYILEGSARRSDQRLRVNVQLVDAPAGGNQVWAERFDRELADIFEVQDEVTRRIVEAIVGKLNAGVVAERYRPTNLEAYDLCVRSRNRSTVSKAANDECRVLLERAISLDPNYCEAHWRLGYAHYFGWYLWGDPQEPNRRLAVSHAQRAVEIDPRDSDARGVLGYILHMDRRYEEAGQQFTEAFRLNPNNAEALMCSVEYHMHMGDLQKGLEAAALGLRLNPHPPGWYYWLAGVAQTASGKYEDAVATLRREETYRSPSRRVLVAALALMGRTEEAKEEAKLYLASDPEWRISTWVEKVPFREPKRADFWVNAFRLAGLPE